MFLLFHSRYIFKIQSMSIIESDKDCYFKRNKNVFLSQEKRAYMLGGSVRMSLHMRPTVLAKI